MPAHMPTSPDTGPPARTGGVLVKEKPPFLVGDHRFSDKDVGVNSKNSPEYHCAYDSIVDKPNRWDTKGWTSLDDPIKPRRGTSTGKLHSSMAPPTSAPTYGASIQPLQALYPNETRLQELLELQRRKLQQGAPSPGTYEAHVPPRRSTFRRPNHPALDGPYFLGEEDGHLAMSTRAKEIAALIRNAGDSGMGPGEYFRDVLAKEMTSLRRNPPAHKIGTSCRNGKGPPHAKSLSVSRSIQHGVSYRVPVIIQAPEAAEATKSKEAQARSSRTAGDISSHTDQLSSLSSAADFWKGLPTTAPSPRSSSHNPPRYMEPIHDASPNRPLRPAKLLPSPPAQIVRAGIPKAKAMLPGDWDWTKLGSNFRTTWTTEGGGAYSHGDRKHLRRSTSPHQSISLRTQPKQGSAQDGATVQPGAADTSSQLSSLWPSFGPESSIDITKLPTTQSPIFPVPEESTLYQDIGGAPISLPPSQHQRSAQQHQPVPSAAPSSRGSVNSSVYPSCSPSREATPQTLAELDAAGVMRGWPSGVWAASLGVQGPAHGAQAAHGHADVASGGQAFDGSAQHGHGNAAGHTTEGAQAATQSLLPGHSPQGSPDTNGRHLGKSNSLLELPAAANLMSPSERDRHRERHDEALQAASMVQQANARKSEWLARSTPPSSSHSRNGGVVRRGGSSQCSC